MDSCLHYLGNVGAALLKRVQIEVESNEPARAAVKAGLVRLLHTEYGEVLILTPQGRRAVEEPPYIASPGSAALRAFQVESGAYCRSQGITDMEAVLKKAGGLRGHEVTDQIVSLRGQHEGTSLIIYPLLRPTLRTIRTRYLQHRVECVQERSRLLFLVPHLSSELNQRLDAFARQESQRGYGSLILRVEVVPYPDASTPPH